MSEKPPLWFTAAYWCVIAVVVACCVRIVIQHSRGVRPSFVREYRK